MTTIMLLLLIIAAVFVYVCLAAFCIGLYSTAEPNASATAIAALMPLFLAVALVACFAALIMPIYRRLYRAGCYVSKWMSHKFLDE